MKKVINLILIITISVSAWEINTHRAIDRKAIEKSKNLKSFINNSGLKNQNYKNEKFEGYSKSYYAGDYSYIDYVLNGEEDGISADKWKQYFNVYNVDYQNLIEAGTILEDALYADSDIYAFGADGRFNNHFYDAQNGGHALTIGYGLRTNALKWAEYGARDSLGERINKYSYSNALNYFRLGFTEKDPKARRKYQAKMLVSVGHLMHMVNDMKEEV